MRVAKSASELSFCRPGICFGVTRLCTARARHRDKASAEKVTKIAAADRDRLIDRWARRSARQVRRRTHAYSLKHTSVLKALGSVGVKYYCFCCQKNQAWRTLLTSGHVSLQVLDFGLDKTSDGFWEMNASAKRNNWTATWEHCCTFAITLD